MEFPVSQHADAQHTCRDILDDVQRMMDADEYTRATCSFPRKEWRDVLIEETIRLESNIFELWRSDKFGPRRIAITHTFDESDAERLRVPTTYLGVYADEVGCLHFGTTSAISVVLDRTRNGIEVFNAFPNMSLSNRTPLEVIDILPYVQQTSRWKTANLMRRTYYRAKCDKQLTHPVSWNSAISQIELPIREGERTLGTVQIGLAQHAWHVNGDSSPIINDNESHRATLSRAFPETYAATRRIDELRETEAADALLLENAANQIELPDIVSRFCYVPVTEKTEKADGEVADKKDSEAAHRAAKKAKARSQKAGKASGRKAKKNRKPKTKAKAKPAATAKPAEHGPFQFKRVMTRFEEFGHDQATQNRIVLAKALTYHPMLVNDLEQECLIPGVVFEHLYFDTESDIVLAPLTLDEAKSIMDSMTPEIEEYMKKHGSEKGTWPAAEKHEPIMRAIKNKAVFWARGDTPVITGLLDKIAQDPHWHIVMAPAFESAFEKDSVDSMDRPIHRVTDENAEHVTATHLFPKDNLVSNTETIDPEQQEKNRQQERLRAQQAHIEQLAKRNPPKKAATTTEPKIPRRITVKPMFSPASDITAMLEESAEQNLLERARKKQG